MFAAEPDNLSSIPKVHMEAGEKSSDLHMDTGVHVHTCTYGQTHNKQIK